MKTRIKYFNGWYYPQVKTFLFWNYLQKNSDYACFTTVEDALEFVKSDEWKYQNQVVWEGEV